MEVKTDLKLKERASWQPDFSFDANDVHSCRICLETSYNVKMYNLLIDKTLQVCLDFILKVQNSPKPYDGLPKYVCYQCAGVIIKCHKLVEKLRLSEETCADITTENGLITKELIEEHRKTKPKLFSSLDSCRLVNYYHIQYDDESHKSQVKAYAPGKPEPADIKESQDEVVLKSVKCELENDDKRNEMYVRVNPESLQLANLPPKRRISKSSVEEYSVLKSPHELTIQQNFSCMELSLPPKRRISKSSVEEYSVSMSPHELAIQQNFNCIDLSYPAEQTNEWKRCVAEHLSRQDMVLVCDTCYKLFTNITVHRTHVLGHRQRGDRFRCGVCLLRFYNIEAVQLHVDRMHSKKYYCKHCSKNFVIRDDVNEHMAVCCANVNDCRRYPWNVNQVQQYFFAPREKTFGLDYQE